MSKLTDPEVDMLDRKLPVLIPVGLVEAHGPHLETGFDACSAEWVARKLCEATGAILCPTIHYGYADTNRGYAGTLGVTPETLGMVIGDLCEMLCEHGFKKIVGAVRPRRQRRRRDARLRTRLAEIPDLKPVHWCYFTAGGVPMSHADAGETSLAIAIGGVVHMDRARDFKVTKPWHEDRSRRDIAPDSGGVNGEASKATREQGEAILAKFMPLLIEKLKVVVADRS